MMFNIKSVCFGVSRELYERFVVATVTYGEKIQGKEVDERRKLNFMEMKCIRSL